MHGWSYLSCIAQIEVDGRSGRRPLRAHIWLILAHRCKAVYLRVTQVDPVAHDRDFLAFCKSLPLGKARSSDRVTFELSTPGQSVMR